MVAVEAKLNTAVEQVLSELDTDGDSSVTLTEVMDFLGGHSADRTPKEGGATSVLRAAWQAHVVLQDARSRLEATKKATDDKGKEMFDIIDENGDGVLSVQEILSAPKRLVDAQREAAKSDGD